MFDGRQVVARHPRLTRRYTYHDILDHYLEILLVKPGAFAVRLRSPRRGRRARFTKVHEAFWAAAKRKAGDREGTRMLIEVLLLHRQLPAEALAAGMETCLRIGSVSTDLVAIEARKAMEDTDSEDLEPSLGLDEDGTDTEPRSENACLDGGAQVISLSARRLPADTRISLPDMSKYASGADRETEDYHEEGPRSMTPQQSTVTDEQVPPRRMPLPGDPEDMLIDDACRDLRLPAFRERFVELAATARHEQASYKQFLLDLLQVEFADRDVRRQQRLVQLAKFPRPKRLEDFDFTRNPNVTPEVVAALRSPGWVREGRPLVLIGDSGKSHLLIGIGTAVAEAGLSVRYTTTSALVNELAEADAGRRLSSVIARYSKVDLLCLDEFGYLNLDRKGAKLLFQIFTEREERKATAVATNSPFAEWDKIFGNPRLCAAIADRITFRATLIQTGTESYRYQSTAGGGSGPKP
ncbi:IS21-like element helper ATPase IstB [Streptomyces sp. NPDC015127]|uniref:IS21-like element helper ATPase IstB n=1 Tax=Streptomyces sp. NPDC015127 TaxID=3364939 RepID=UPI00370057A6